MNRQQQIDEFSLRAHRLAVQRLHANPERLGDLVATLDRWRAQNGATRSDVYFAEWRSMLASGIDAVEAGTCSNEDRAVVLRSVSPVGILITQQERAEMLRAVREETVPDPSERRCTRVEPFP